MKDFTLRNDTRLLFRRDPMEALMEVAAEKQVLFVYGGGCEARGEACGRRVQ